MRTLLSLIPLAMGLLLATGSVGCDEDECADAKCVADTGAPTDTAPDTTEGDAAADTVPADTAVDTTPADTAVDTTPPDTAPAVDLQEVVVPAGTAVMSDKDLYQVWFDGKASIRVGVETSYVVTVQDLGGQPVVGLDLAPTFIHASMGHGGPKNPRATEVGAGVYDVTSVAASMSGTWHLDIALPGDDEARFIITVSN